MMDKQGLFSNFFLLPSCLPIRVSLRFHFRTGGCMLLTRLATYPRLRAISPGSPSQASFKNHGARMERVVFKSGCDEDDTDDDDDDVF